MNLAQAITLWIASHVPHAHAGVATTFDRPEVDPFNKGGMACTGRVKLTPLQRALVESGAIVAHKTLPCGTILLIHARRTLKTALAITWDRGPRRAMLDLWRDLAALLHSDGKEQVIAITFGAK